MSEEPGCLSKFCGAANTCELAMTNSMALDHFVLVNFAASIFWNCLDKFGGTNFCVVMLEQI
jgi:hypothetical protein